MSIFAIEIDRIIPLWFPTLFATYSPHHFHRGHRSEIRGNPRAAPPWGCCGRGRARAAHRCSTRSPRGPPPRCPRRATWQAPGPWWRCCPGKVMMGVKLRFGKNWWKMREFPIIYGNSNRKNKLSEGWWGWHGYLKTFKIYSNLLGLLLDDFTRWGSTTALPHLWFTFHI